MRIGVYGLGRIGLMHARNIAQTDEVDEVVLIGREAERLAAAQERLEAALAADAPAELAGRLAGRAHRARIMTTLKPFEQAIRGLDGVIVATVTATHPELAVTVAQEKIPLLIEKPLTLSSAELLSLSERLEEIGSPVMVAFHRRYDPAHQRLRALVKSGAAGTVRAAHAINHDHYPLSLDYIPASGGMWNDLLVHDFDIIPWVLGEEVVQVSASGSVLDEAEYARHGDVDTGLAVLTLASGALATVSGTRRNGAGQDVRLEVFGSDGSFAAGLDDHLAVTSTDPGIPAPGAVWDDFSDRFEAAFRAEAAHFVKLIGGQAQSLTPPRAGLAAIRIAEAAARSFATGVPAAITPVMARRS